MANPTNRVTTATGVVVPGYRQAQGSDPFYNLPVDTEMLYNWLATRKAVRQDATFSGGITDNDLLNAWRVLSTPEARYVNTNSLVFLDGFRKYNANISGANTAQAGVYKAQVAVADVSNYDPTAGGLKPRATVARVRMPSGAASAVQNVGVVGVWAFDGTDVTPSVYVGARGSASINDVRAFLDLADYGVGINRAVANVVTVERAKTTTPGVIYSATRQNYVALGLRLNGTSASVFLNGLKVGDTITLSGAAQALVGGDFVFGQAAGGASLQALVTVFEAFLLT